MINFRPCDTIQKILISTTSRFTGEYKDEDDEFLITQAWQFQNAARSKAQFTETPISRNAFVVVFRTEPIERKPGVIIPDYSFVGNIICSYLSVFFGKRFDNHGLLEGSGHYQVPDYSLFQSFCQPDLPQNNHKPRKDFGIPLQLGELLRIKNIFTGSVDEKFLRFFQTAAKFYSQALQNFEQQPEIAYLNLITAGEIISNYFQYPKDELLDANIKEILNRIESEIKGGDRLVNDIKSRLLQVKRRFLNTIEKLVNSYFFNNSESVNEYSALKESNFSERVSAAYDLRSRYVHTGIPFGNWIATSNAEEIHLGTPVIGDKELEKIIFQAPTYFGMERIIRFCLMRLLHINEIHIDRNLDDTTESDRTFHN